MTLITVILVSCAPTMYRLEGKYLDAPYQITSTKSFDQVWTNIIDFFATKGISIKVIDRSSGLIVSEKTSFKNSYSFEEKGKPKNPNAYIVLSAIEVNGVELHPQTITAEWNIRIKTNDKGGTIVNVNMTNIQANYYQAPVRGTYLSQQERNYDFDGKSTGVFEKTISDQVK